MNFRKLERRDMELVLEWRTSEHVTTYMYTDIEKNLDRQYAWFDKITKDPTQYYWIIEYRDTPIGLISMVDLNREHGRASLGFYIGDLNYARLAGHVHAYLYNFAFFELGLNKLSAEVMEGNEGIMKIHLHHGFKQVGMYQKHIFKYDRYHDVYYFELLAETWKEEYTRFHRYTTSFSLD